MTDSASSLGEGNVQTEAETRLQEARNRQLKVLGALRQTGGGAKPGLAAGPSGEDKKFADLRKKHAQCIKTIQRTGSRTPPQTRRGDGRPDDVGDNLSGTVGSLKSVREVFETEPEGSQEGDAISECTAQSVPVMYEDPVVKAMYYLQKWQASEASKMMGCVEELYQDMGRDMKDLWRALQEMSAKLEALQEQNPHFDIKALKESVETSARMGTLRVQEITLVLENLKQTVALQARGIEDIKAQAGSSGNCASTRDMLEAHVRGFASLHRNPESVDSLPRDMDAHCRQLENISSQIALHHEGHRDKCNQLRSSLALQDQFNRLQVQVEVAHSQHATEKEAHKRAAAVWKDEHARLEDEVTGKANDKRPVVTIPQNQQIVIAVAAGAAIAALFRLVFCFVPQTVTRPAISRCKLFPQRAPHVMQCQPAFLHVLVKPARYSSLPVRIGRPRKRAMTYN